MPHQRCVLIIAVFFVLMQGFLLLNSADITVQKIFILIIIISASHKSSTTAIVVRSWSTASNTSTPGNTLGFVIVCMKQLALWNSTFFAPAGVENSFWVAFFIFFSQTYTQINHCQPSWFSHVLPIYGKHNEQPLHQVHVNQNGSFEIKEICVEMLLFIRSEITSWPIL